MSENKFSNENEKHIKYGTYLSAAAIILTVIGAITYVSSVLSEMKTKLDFMERISKLEKQVEHLEKEKK